MKNNLPQRTQSAQRRTVAPHVRATVELSVISVFSVAKGCSYDK